MPQSPTHPPLLPVLAGLLAALLLFLVPLPSDTAPALSAGLRLVSASLLLALTVPSLSSRPLPRALSAHLPLLSALSLLSLWALLRTLPPGLHPFQGLLGAPFGLPAELPYLFLALSLRPHASPAPFQRLAPAFALLALSHLLVPVYPLGDARLPLLSLLRHPATLPLLFAALGLPLLALARPLSPALRRLLPRALPAFFVLFATLPLLSPAPLLALAALAPWLALLLLATPPTDPRPLAWRIFWPALIVALWFIIKSQALIASPTDENIYFYMAHRLSEGSLPYRDFFFAHPPLHLVVPAALFWVFGYSLGLAKLIPIAATLLGALALYRATARYAGAFAALLVLTFTLFALEILKASSNMTGINLSLMWLLLGLSAAILGQGRRTGLFLAFAVTTGFYTIAPALAILVLYALSRPLAWRSQRKAPLTFFAVALGINLFFYALGGESYLDGVYRYHGLKAFQNPDMLPLFGGEKPFPLSLGHNLSTMLGSLPLAREFYYHPHLWLSPLAAPGLYLLARRFLPAPPDNPHAHTASPPAAPEKSHTFRAYLRHLNPQSPTGLHLWGHLIALSLLLEFAMFRELYSFYFALIYPFLALSLALNIDLLRRLFLNARPPAFAPRRLQSYAYPALLALSLFVLAAIPRFEAHHAHAFPEEFADTGARNPYIYPPETPLALFPDLVQGLFWKDHRLKAGPEAATRYFLWTKTRPLQAHLEVASAIQDLVPPDRTLSGASSLAPLIALSANRRLAGDEADTNYKRFQTGLLSEEAYWQLLCDDHIHTLIAAPRSYFTTRRLDQHPFVRRHFEKGQTFIDRTVDYGRNFPITLYHLREDSPCQAGTL